MVAPISHNAILASFFGTAPARSPFGRSPIGSGETESIGRTSNVDAYTQPTDSAEFSASTRGVTSTPEPPNAAERSGASPAAQNLSEEEKAVVRELRQRDQEVRRHEQAHQAAAGSAAVGGPSFEYTTGPDGKRYATGGEVNIDTAEVSGNPRATVAKMQQIQRAARAPANPSSQDRAVAAQAAATERAAKAELASAESTDTEWQTGSSLKTVGQPTVTDGVADYSSPTPGALLDLIA